MLDSPEETESNLESRDWGDAGSFVYESDNPGAWIRYAESDVVEDDVADVER
jgi:hypothetical protein